VTHAARYQLSQALYVAAKLGVADVLASGPLAANAIAEAVEACAPQLRRVLRALVAAGLFIELDDGRFALNDAAAALRADAPGRTWDVTINFGEEIYRSFGELLHTVRTEETAFDSVYGQPLFHYYAENPEAEASGAARMLARTLPVARELAASDVLRCARTLIDVGGGTGTGAHLSEQGVVDRCDLIEGDFFLSVPTGGDVYVLKSVLHDWDDPRCVTILRNCRSADARAREAGGRGACASGAHDAWSHDSCRRASADAARSREALAGEPRRRCREHSASHRSAVRMLVSSVEDSTGDSTARAPPARMSRFRPVRAGRRSRARPRRRARGCRCSR
jgi:hypothetical protein